MPKESDKAKWKKAKTRYEEIHKRIRPFVGSSKEKELATRESWRRSGDLQDDGSHGFRTQL